VKQIRDELAVDQEFVQRFVEEAKTTVALSHPNIVPVYELGIEMGTYYLAMELVDGVSVDQLLVRSPETGAKVGLSPEEGATIGVEVCRALDYAHRRMQVIHRDVTPRNVMVDEEGQVKIIDFGIAARASVAGQDVFGTPGHMPPEQLRREAIGPPTDIFAVAVLLMELWSGSPPFRRKTPVDSLAQMHAPHPKPSGIDPRLAPLDAIMSSAMALAKADRPQNADDLGRALRKFLADTDSGDIERKLGARVRDARVSAAAAAQKKKARSSDSLFKPSRPSIPDMGPRTFAARSEVDHWKPEASSDAGGTRRLPSSEHPPPKDGPASAPQEEAPKIETVATRPIETPIGPPPASEVPPRRGRGMALVAAAIAVPLAVWGVMRATADPVTGAPRPPVTAPSPTTPTATATPLATSTATPTAAPNTTATSPSGTATATATTAASAAIANGTLTLVGDGTQAQVDDASPRPCPYSIAIKPGSHRVTFTFEPTHETLGEQVTLGVGKSMTVRADFTAATPHIKIQP
jgi:eukaryotic-like serine/threonine-protein kinase